MEARDPVQGVPDIDVFDLEVGSENPKNVIRFCQLLEPTVGGINLEDIRSPTCFTSNRAAATKGIPVFHDDQHGPRSFRERHYSMHWSWSRKRSPESDRVRRRRRRGHATASITFDSAWCARTCDVRSQGVIYKGPRGLDEFKQRFAVDTKARTPRRRCRARTCRRCRWPDRGPATLLQGMAKKPVIFALANQHPRSCR